MCQIVNRLHNNSIFILLLKILSYVTYLFKTKSYSLFKMNVLYALLILQDNIYLKIFHYIFNKIV